MESGERTLKDCRPEQAFWVHSGVVCRNIYELVNTIRCQNRETFQYHVNVDRFKNDYACWIKDVLGDEELAVWLSNVFEQDRYVDIIEQRIIEREGV